jgi:plasmid stabilization system protein ParE
MEVRWSPEAADDLEQIVRYIQRDNPEVARKVAAIIIDAAGGLSTFPKRGGWVESKAPASWLLLLYLGSRCIASR